MRAPGRSQRAVAWLLGIFFLAVYLLTGSSDLRNNGDTTLRVQTTESIVEAHHIWIDHPIWTDTRVVRGNGGHLYAFYAPGQSTLMIPLYLAGKAVAKVFSLPQDIAVQYGARSLDLFLGAALAVLVFLMACSLGYSLGVSAILALLFGLATPAWPDAQSQLEQTQLDLFLLAAVYAAWRYVREEPARTKWLVLSGTAAGLTLVSRYDAAIMIPVVGAYPMLTRFVRHGLRRAIRDALVFAAALVPWLGVLFAWNWARFGSPFLTGLHERTFGEPPWEGLANLVLSPGKGILWYMPLLFLLPFVVRGFYRRAGSFAWFALGLVLAPLVFYANVLYWHGDPAWGPRYLYVALPYLVLPLGELLSRWRSVRLPLKTLFAGLVLLSLVIDISAVSVTMWRFWDRIETGTMATYKPAQWAGQPFHWGSQHYHYYWTPRLSPVLVQVDNLYQVVRLALGDRKYHLVGRPDPWVSSPVDNYPVNTPLFWWADVRHPLFGPHTRAALAALLALVALAALAALARLFRGSTQRAVGYAVRSPRAGPSQAAS